MNFTQYESSPNGLSYLSGDIMPWHDYVIFRSDEDTSVAVYGAKSDGLYFEDATVRTVRRSGSGYNNYVVHEYTGQDVTVDIINPYYAYGNVIGVSYALPSSSSITSLFVCSSVVVCALVSVFRLVWSLKRGVVK